MFTAKCVYGILYIILTLALYDKVSILNTIELREQKVPYKPMVHRVLYPNNSCSKISSEALQILELCVAFLKNCRSWKWSSINCLSLNTSITDSRVHRVLYNECLLFCMSIFRIWQLILKAFSTISSTKLGQGSTKWID